MPLILLKLLSQRTSVSKQRHPENPARDTRGCKSYRCFVKALWPMPVKTAHLLPPQESQCLFVSFAKLLGNVNMVVNRRGCLGDILSGMSSISEANQG